MSLVGFRYTYLFNNNFFQIFKTTILDIAKKITFGYQILRRIHKEKGISPVLLYVQQIITNSLSAVKEGLQSYYDNVYSSNTSIKCGYWKNSEDLLDQFNFRTIPHKKKVKKKWFTTHFCFKMVCNVTKSRINFFLNILFIFLSKHETKGK